MSSEQLLVADYRAGRNYAVRDGVADPLGAGVLAEHAGFLTLPPDNPSQAAWAYADDRAGALVVGGPCGERHIPIAIPGEHLACDRSGRYVVVTTGVGANAAPWSDVVTLVDLTGGGSVRFRVRTGEPGAMVVPEQGSGRPFIVLRHREPGALEAVAVTDAAAVGPHVPELRGSLVSGIAADGHGDAVDQRTGIAATATSRGLERFVVKSGRPRTIGIVPWPVPGRAFYLRFDPATGRVVAVVRGGPHTPERWTEWTNTLVDIDLSTGATRHLPLPPGLAFRFALGGDSAAVATIHPDGDAVTLVGRGGSELAAAYEASLPAMSHPPIPGRLPWDPVGDAPAQRRAIALDRAGTTIAVTRGGDGELHLVRDGEVATLALPSALDEGGHLLWYGPPAGPDVDSIGR